jgi:phosphoribosylanthranilate isomerase
MVNIKICGITNLEDAKLCVSAGVNLLGFVVDIPTDLPFKISEENAKKIITSLPKNTEKVMITTFSDPVKTKKLCNSIGATAIQIAASSRISPEELATAKGLFKGIKIIKSVPLVDASSVENALAYADIADILLIENRGVSNQKPDWKLAAELVRKCKKPVMLAGGLNPENIAVAINSVKPWGIDVMSGVEDSTGKKSAAKVKELVTAVQNAKL